MRAFFFHAQPSRALRPCHRNDHPARVAATTTLACSLHGALVRAQWKPTPNPDSYFLPLL